MSARVAESLSNESDRDLAHRVALYLSRRHIFSLRTIKVEARAGTVTLRGDVYSFHERQIAVSSAQRVAGVYQVIDALDVVARPSSGDSARRRLVFSPALVEYFAQHRPAEATAAACWE